MGADAGVIVARNRRARKKVAQNLLTDRIDLVEMKASAIARAIPLDLPV